MLKDTKEAWMTMRLLGVWGKGCMNGTVGWPCTGDPQTGSRHSCESNENRDPLSRKMFTEHVAKCSHTSNFITLTIDFSLYSKHRKILYLRFMSSWFFQTKSNSCTLKKRKVNWIKKKWPLIPLKRNFHWEGCFSGLRTGHGRAVCALHCCGVCIDP